MPLSKNEEDKSRARGRIRRGAKPSK